MGLRGKDRAMAVPSLSRLVLVAATARGRNGSWVFSMLQAASKPTSSA